MYIELVVSAFQKGHDLLVEITNLGDELCIVFVGKGLKFFLDLDVVPICVLLDI
jgi:hypothetical protein